MSNLDMTAMAAALKELYKGQKVQEMLYKKNPFFAMVSKDTKFVGEGMPIPLITAPNASGSAEFASALAYQAPAKLQKFYLTRVKDYTLATIDHETQLATASDAGAFISAAKVNVDQAYRTITNSLASSMYRTPTGTIGYGVFTTADSKVALTYPAMATQFEVGMTLVPSASDGGAIVSSAGVGYVCAVDRINGTITLATSRANCDAGTSGNPANWSNSTTYYLTRVGDLNSKMAGLQAWLPATKSGTLITSFFGMNRSNDVTRLSGVAYDGSGVGIEEAFITTATLCAEQGGSPGHIFTNYRSYNALVQALGSKVQREDVEAAGIGFSSIKIHGNDGEIRVIPDRNCPAYTAFLLDLETWKLHSLGEAPQILDYGDGKTIRVSNEDAAQLRVGFYGNLACTAPGFNAQITLGA